MNRKEIDAMERDEVTREDLEDALRRHPHFRRPDRLLHHAETIVIKGKSFRVKDANPDS